MLIETGTALTDVSESKQKVKRNYMKSVVQVTRWPEALVEKWIMDAHGKMVEAESGEGCCINHELFRQTLLLQLIS